MINFIFDLSSARVSRSNLSFDKMTTNLRVEDRLVGADNFRSWKHRILLILEENDLLDYVKEVTLNRKKRRLNKVQEECGQSIKDSI